MRRTILPAASLAACLALVSQAEAACPARLGVAWGDTLTSIARACGVNVEALRQVNPGLTAQTLRAGSFIAVPRPALASPQLGVGRRSVHVAPPLVPPATGGPAIGGAPSTVILPPARPPVPQQHIIRGFDDRPGQLPLPPGHPKPLF